MRVAILGGGVASLATALELTDPAQNGRYDVTIYQLGWRLGGKCASGRNREMHDAIEEHGLHVFFGFYDNAFAMLRACYEELGRDPKSPFPTIFDALEPNSNLSVLEEVGGKWLSWSTALPMLPGLPGDPNPPTLGSAIFAAVKWLLDRIHALHTECGAHAVSTPAAVQGAVGAQDLAAHISRTSPNSAVQEPEQHNTWAELVEKAWHEFLEILAKLSSLSTELRRRVIEADLVATNVIGILREGLLTDPQTATRKMNQVDYRDWLASHGAMQMTVDSALVRTLYDLIFAYPDGDNSQKGNIEAGSTVNTLLQMWLYRGAVTYKMRAGTGDVVIAPMYQVLRKRGVKFEFFSRVTDLVPADDGSSIQQITISRQVNLLDQSYLPLFDCKGLPSWPNAPHYDQIVEGAALKAGGIDLESRWSGWQDTGGTRTLVAGTDFDVAVLGISLAALPEICSKLVAQKKPWQDMIAAVKTVQTQSVQMRLDCTLAQTGWTGPPGTLAGAYDVSEMDTWADISEILAKEDWPAPAPKTQLTFCGPMKGPAAPPPAGKSDFPKKALDQVTATTRAFLETSSAPIWPALNGARGFDWDMLHDESGAKGADRLAAQYLRANIDPTERYVQTVAGSSQFRLRTDQSGYDNLYLTGDWIDNPMNLGAFEATVMSGKLASRAISGLPRSLMRVPADSPYLRQRPPLPRPRPKVDFIVHGGVQSFPGPIVFDSATLWAFFVPGDLKAMTALANKFFVGPTGGKLNYVPLFPSVLLTVANIPHGRFRNDPGMGYSQEAELAAWMFLGQVSPDGTQLDDVVAFCPYLFLDNPIALTTGREVFGYLKQRGWITVTPQQDGMDSLSIDAFGTPDTGAGARWQQQPFLKIDPQTVPSGTAPNKINTMEDAISVIQAYLTQKKVPALPTLDAMSRLYGDLKAGVVNQLFIKQFRDFEYPETACYQAIATAPAKVTRSEGIHYTTNYNVSLNNLTNIPMFAELGIPANCKSELAMKLVLDMTVSPGSVLWQARI